MSFYPKPEGREQDSYVDPCPVRASEATLELLDRLHALSTEQEQAIYNAEVGRVGFDNYMRDKFIALDKDKCWFVYQTCLAIGARNVVEAGTSFGVSTSYLSLAVQQTIKARRGDGRVIATENEPDKAAKARSIWEEAGESVADCIELREGDLRETLKDNLPEIDLMLLDIIICDNSISSSSRYANLQAYMRDPKNGYTNLTIPYHNGLEMSVYLGNKEV